MAAQSKNQLRYLLLRLWEHIGARRRTQFVVVFFLTVIASFAEILTIGAVLPFLMALTAPQDVFAHPLVRPLVQYLSISSGDELLRVLTFSFAAAAMLAGLFRVGLLWVNNQVSCRTGADLSNEIYRRTLHQPFVTHISRNTNEIISGVMVKSNAVVSNVLTPILSLISAAIMMCAVFGTLLIVNPVVALSSAASFGLIYGAIIKLTRRKLKVNSERSSSELNRAFKALQDGLGGIRDVLIDGSQKIYCKAYGDASIRMRNAQANTLFIGQCPRYLIEAMGTVLIAIIAYVLARRTEGLGDALPVLGALALGAQRLLPVIQQAYASWTSVHGSRAHLRDTIELLDQPLPKYVDGISEAQLKFEREICLEQVSFRYAPNAPWVLSGVELSITKGARVGFIGSTGSGKSTILDIVMGLLSPTSGSLKIDGQVLTPENQRLWQALIAHVPQSIFLSDSSIAENIAFGLPREQVDMVRVYRAAHQAQIAEVIESWANGYETAVGERGIRLSGGQRQRIGIARALYKQAKVIVFDEATSALDGQTEDAVMRAIENLGRDLTILIVAHRISTLRICDEVVELSNSGVLRRVSYSDLVSPR